MGCQDLLEEVPGRSKREKDSTSSPGDLRSFVKGVTSRSSSKSYSVKDETSSKCALHVFLESAVGVACLSSSLTNTSNMWNGAWFGLLTC